MQALSDMLKEYFPGRDSEKRSAEEKESFLSEMVISKVAQLVCVSAGAARGQQNWKATAVWHAGHSQGKAPCSVHARENSTSNSH